MCWHELEAERDRQQPKDDGLFVAAMAVGLFAITCGVLVLVAFLKWGWL